MSFFEELAAHNIDIDQYLALQNEFIEHCRKRLESESKRMSYSEYLERDQLLMKMETLVNKLERERLQLKIQELSSIPSSL